MKKNFLRAAALAGFSLFATLTALPPQAAAADQAKGPSISAKISKQIVAAQKALQDKDWATALASLKDAQGVSGLTDYDTYIINRFSGIAEYQLHQGADAAAAMTAAAESPAAPAAERADVLRLAIELQNDAGNYAKVAELAKLAESQNISDPTVSSVVAIAYLNQKDYADAAVYAQKAVDQSAAAGKIPDRSDYLVLLQCASNQHDLAAETKVLEQLSTLYGQPADWGNLIDFAFAALNTPNKDNRELAALFLSRLRLITKAQTSSDYYMLGAEVAMSDKSGLDSPGDAQHMLHAGIDSGALSEATAAALLAQANAKAKGDQATLPTVEKLAAKQASGIGDVSAAEGYYGYGQYADAERVAKLAVSKNGPKQMEALMVLGSAQAAQGEDDAATQTFALVKGDPAIERVAALWTLYTTRKYGAAAAPAPAGN
jgi:hypothetical protein